MLILGFNVYLLRVGSVPSKASVYAGFGLVLLTVVAGLGFGAECF